MTVDAFQSLGTVTAPSGALVLVDFGLLDLWSGDGAPRMPEWAAPPDVVALANGAIDYEVEGRDALDAVRHFGGASGRLYDRPSAFADTFAEARRAESWDASLRALPRVSHAARVRHALSAGDAVTSFHGVGVVCLGDLPGGAMTVRGTRGPEDRWDIVELVVRAGDVSGTRRLGHVAVDRARLAFMDLEAMAAWEHHESLDGLADLVFWGRDAAVVAKKTGAATLTGGRYGWLDQPIARAVELEATITRLRRDVVVDSRPHSDHHRLLEPIRHSPTESATVEVGGARVCGFMTTWGDGFFPAELDVDATGAPLILRLRMAEL